MCDCDRARWRGSGGVGARLSAARVHIPPGEADPGARPGSEGAPRNQSDERRGHIPTGWTSQMMGEATYPQGGPII
eukprot:9436686-Pyramimonas_sp.AAC.1